MSTSTSPTELRVERTYGHPPQRVFDAWTHPEVMRRWWHAGDTSWENIEAEVDLRVGGRLRIAMRDADGGVYGASAQYTEIDPPRRLAFTWTWDDSERTSDVSIDFRETPDGGTTVVLTHGGLADEASRDGHTDGWNHVLDHLETELAG